jgi:hypothetical protein
MSKSDLQARPVYHSQRDSIEAHLTIMFAAPHKDRISVVGPPGRLLFQARGARGDHPS